MRCLQYLLWLESAVIEYVVSPLFDDAMLLRKYRHGGYSLLKLLADYWQRIHAGRCTDQIVRVSDVRFACGSHGRHR